jgi:hypothetical protein
MNLQTFKEMILKNGLLENFAHYDDIYLLRFLRARKFDLDKTYLMFKAFIDWRKENDVDNIEVLEFLKKINFLEF